MNPLSSYGYYFNINAPQNGRYLLLPDAHNASERIAAIEGIESNYDHCALFYSSDGENFIPFSHKAEDPTTLVVDKLSRVAFWMNYKDFQLVDSIGLISHFQDYLQFERYQENIKFNKAKEWIQTNYPKTSLKFITENGSTQFLLTVSTLLEEDFSIQDEDLISAIINMYESLSKK